MRIIMAALATLFIGSVSAAACPVVSVGVTELYVSEADLASPFGASVVAGGDQNLANCGYAGGFVISQPDFSVNLADVSGPLQVSVASPDCDTVLLVNAPDGSWWYNDDSGESLEPWMQVDVTPGRMDVWVGTYDGSFCDATLVLN